MQLIQWDEKLITNIDLIDSQHRELFKVINSFYIKCQFNYTVQAVIECVRYLEQYALFHFQAEEAFQREYKYPLTDEHQAKHDILKIKILHLASKIDENELSNEMIAEFFQFINNNLYAHILNDDIAYAEFIRNCN